MRTDKSFLRFSFGSFVAFFLIVLGLIAAVRSEEEKQKEKYGHVIGIDLGTTYSCVGVYRNKKVEIIANEQGNRITPSYVAFTAKGDQIVGEAAKNQLSTNPANTIYDAKRLIGRDFEDTNLQMDLKRVDYKVTKKGNRPYIHVKQGDKNRQIAPEEISASVLRKMKEIAENYIGEKVTHAVVTVPAYFNDAQRQATKDAGSIAGLNILRVINEPTAAAIAYGLDKKGKEMNILVYDLGGGTFDVSVLTIDNGVFEVKATSGDTHLGGQDFDNNVMDHITKVFASQNKLGTIDVGAQSRGRLRHEVERVKRMLSSVTSATIEIPFFYQSYNLTHELTRAKFEEINLSLFKKTLKPVKQVLKDAGLSKNEIDEIVLVGGSTRIPRIQTLLQDFFDGRKLSKDINPDEAVAYGAAVQGGVLSGDSTVDNVLLLDVNPLTLGIETTGGIMAKLIPRSTSIPVKKSQIFSTAADNQQTVSIKVYEGERAETKHNNLLGEFELSGIPPAPRGVPRIEVSFEIDANGILHVGAKDLGTGNEKKVKIDSEKSSRLSQEEIDRMIKEASEYEEQDNLIRAKIESKNSFESYAYSLRAQFTGELAKKVTAEEKETVLAAVEKAVKFIETLDMETVTKEQIDEQKTELENVAKPILTAMYGKTGGEDGEEEERSSEDATRTDDEHDEL